MLVAREFLGTLADDELAARADAADALTVTVDDTDRRRSRVRTTADDGTDVGIVVARKLRDGDVLDADGRPVVVSLEPVDVLAVDLSGVSGSPSTVAATALELGHAVGNRHWDLALEGTTAYFPVTDDPERMEREVTPHCPEGATVGYDAVSPALFDDGQVGGHGDSAGHSHSDADGHGNAGGHDHAHGADGHSHGHDDHGHDHSHDRHGHDSGVRSLDSGGETR
jgi:urease accessory protein